MKALWQEIEAQISAASGTPFSIESKQPKGGGSINEAFHLQGLSGEWFVKLNSSDQLDMFAAEAEGLQALASANAIQVPTPLVWGIHENRSFLVLEYLPISGAPDPERFGHALAAMHLNTRKRFGWHRDNTIGSTPQINAENDDWISFWRQNRLEYQLQLAQRHGASSQLFDKGMALAANIASLFSGYTPVASILHGDLWSGNWGAVDRGTPVIFDPAVYYGDHETDLAMMTLFGSPGTAFFSSYHEVFPIDSGFEVRKTLYNLYHILNHFNLFGGGYAHQAEAMIDRLMEQVGRRAAR